MPQPLAERIAAHVKNFETQTTAIPEVVAECIARKLVGVNELQAGIVGELQALVDTAQSGNPLTEGLESYRQKILELKPAELVEAILSAP